MSVMIYNPIINTKIKLKLKMKMKMYMIKIDNSMISVVQKIKNQPCSINNLVLELDSFEREK